MCQGDENDLITVHWRCTQTREMRGEGEIVIILRTMYFVGHHHSSQLTRQYLYKSKFYTYHVFYQLLMAAKGLRVASTFVR
jgi:hypothetical protein